VAGTFNNWDPSQYKLRDNAKRGIYKTTLTLSPGQHEYKFIVNGVWCADPGCPDDVLNVHGTHNSVLRI
jgi:1,4-alpha-glucan branching enzyme